MFGFSINLFMDANLPKGNLFVNTQKDNVPHLVWAEYDRVTIEKKDTFSDFFTVDNDVSHWMGSVQTLHLFSDDRFEANKNRIQLRYDTKNELLYSPEDESKHFPLALIMSMKIKEKVFNKSDLSKNKVIIEAILEAVKNESKYIPAQCFFSLGEEDVVLIALGNSVDIFMNIIHKVRTVYFQDRKEKQTLCDCTNSFLIQNCRDTIYPVECKESIANVYISLEKGINEDVFYQKLKEVLNGSDVKIKRPMLFAGEYDIVFELHGETPDKIFKLYFDQHHNCPLNASSDFYKKNIKTSKTVWTQSIQKHNLKSQKICLKLDVKDSIFPETIKINTYNEIQQVLSEMEQNLNHAQDQISKNVYRNIIYFLKDAGSAIMATTSSQWTYIASKQISTFIEIIRFFDQQLFAGENNPYSEKYLTDLNLTISDMRVSFSNINRSHELFFHKPTSSLQYFGSFNTILLAYYSFINKLLNLGYKKPHDHTTSQAKIVFFVYFGMTSKVLSKIYLNNSSDPNGVKLVGFELPYAALYDLNKYFISLTHEVYHMIAPYSRTQRNERLMKLWLKHYISCGFRNYIESIVNNQKALMGNNKSNLDSLIYEFINSIIKEKLSDFASKYESETSIFVDFCKKIKNSIIYEPERLTGFYEYLSQKFAQFCEKKDISNRSNDAIRMIVDLFLVKNTKLSAKETVPADQKTLEVLSNIIESARECICDTFMYLLAFGKTEPSINKYLKYMLTFFDELHIDCVENINAACRIGIFMQWTGTKIESVDLSEADKSRLIEAVSRYKGFMNRFLGIELDILELIKYDDLMCLTRSLLFKQEQKIVFDNVISIQNIIQNSIHKELDNSINLIVSLNQPFKICCPTNTQQHSLDFMQRKVCVICYPRSFESIKSNFARSLDEYLERIRDNNNSEGIIEPSGREDVWYRGVCNPSYGLIPSLFVKLPLNIPPYFFQVSILRECYNATKQYAHSFITGDNSSAAKLSLMQHYGAPTNLLDFSTDPIAALYWALNPEALNDKNKLETAVVYQFYPHKYQNAYKLIREEFRCEDYEYSDYFYGIHTHNCLGSEYIITDTTDRYTAKMLQTFEKNKNAYLYESLEKKKRLLYNSLPLPVIVPRTNDRILAQSGTFVAFSLLNVPKLKTLNDRIDLTSYEYMYLQNIQTLSIKLCNELGINSQKYRFLRKILIPPYSLIDIRKDLNLTFNYSRKSVYPDLEYLFKEVNDRVVKQISKN